MDFKQDEPFEFFSEMSEYQISAREFFSTVLLDSLNRNFGLQRVLIMYFDTGGRFLSWTSSAGIRIDDETHPYHAIEQTDVVRQKIYADSVREHLTYFNTTPKLYRASDIIAPDAYAGSPYVAFLEQQFGAHYSVTMPFGINAYIQVVCMKSAAEGDFSEAELNKLHRVYSYLANSYKNFKKYEQAKIIANIQSEVIASGEKAYLVTDDFMHVMSCNELARAYLKDILGAAMPEQFGGAEPCGWLPFLLGSESEETSEQQVLTRVIQGYIFKVYTYDQTYSNGIVDKYHWITISQKTAEPHRHVPKINQSLTHAEQRVAELMYQGLTYQAIADTLIVSYHTVKKHVQNIYTKCGVSSRYELYKWMENKEHSL